MKIYHRTDPERFEFETTDNLEELDQVIGQTRSVAAMNFGIGVRHYAPISSNLVLFGPGKQSARKVSRV